MSHSADFSTCSLGFATLFERNDTTIIFFKLNMENSTLLFVNFNGKVLEQASGYSDTHNFSQEIKEKPIFDLRQMKMCQTNWSVTFALACIIWHNRIFRLIPDSDVRFRFQNAEPIKNHVDVFVFRKRVMQRFEMVLNRQECKI